MDTIVLSPWGLFLQAGAIVKGVMVALFLASIWCWVVVIESLIMLRRIDRALHGKYQIEYREKRSIVAEIHSSAECVQSFPNEAPGDYCRRVAAAMTRTARERMAEAERGIHHLAIISSVAPFVGLFGTVWGIIGSFAGIAATKETSLAVVAPGIAEALAATAFGLAAAIPASAAYNLLCTAFARRGRALAGMIEVHAMKTARHVINMGAGDAAPGR